MKRHLPEMVPVTVVVFALIVVCISLSSTTIVNPPGPAAHVEIKLGDDWQTIRANSTFAFRDWENYPRGYSIDSGTFTYRYSDPQHGIEFLNTRGLYLAFDHARIREIRVTTYGDNATWDAAAQRVRALVSAMERAGWQPRDAKNIDTLLEKVRAYYANPTFENMMNDFAMGVWLTGGAQIELAFYRVHHRGDIVQGKALPENEYTISVKISREE